MTAVVCCSLNNAIGRNNSTLFKFSNDMKIFKFITMGDGETEAGVIMGSKTFDSIGKPLACRHNIVLTSDPNKYSEVSKDPSFCNTYFVTSMTDALEKAISLGISYTNLFLIGGGKVYNDYIELCDRIIMTRVLKDVEDADTFFPDITDKFVLYSHTDEMIDVTKDTNEEIGYDVEVYVRLTADKISE